MAAADPAAITSGLTDPDRGFRRVRDLRAAGDLTSDLVRDVRAFLGLADLASFADLRGLLIYTSVQKVEPPVKKTRVLVIIWALIKCLNRESRENH
jgi:hypothetical protein